MKKFLSIVLALALCLCILPAAVSAAEEDAGMPDVSTTGLNLTGVTEETIYKAGDGTITFTPAADGQIATLTLNNAAITASNGTFAVPAIQIPEGMEIEIVIPEGTESTLSSVKGDAINHRGAPLTVSGTGTLNITSYGKGISNDDDLKAAVENKGSTLKIKDVTLRITSTGRSYCIYEGTSIDIENAVISAYSESTSSDAIYADDSITITNSSIDVSGSYYDGIANSNDFIVMENSKISIYTCHGMNAYESLTIKNTSLTITSTDSYETAAIFFVGPFVIEDSSVTIHSAGTSGITSSAKRPGTITIQGSSRLETSGATSGISIPKADAIEIGAGLAISEGEILSNAAENTTQTSVTFIVEPILYTVTFNSQGGSEIDSQTVAHGSAVAQPETPIRDNYAFGGWFTDELCTNMWDFDNDVVTDNMTLYAKWLSTDAGITEVSVADVLGTISGNEISVVLPSDVQKPTDSSAISIIPAEGATVSDLVTYDDGETWTFTVTAEDGVTVQTYTIVVTNDSPSGGITIPPYLLSIAASGHNCPSQAFSDLDTTKWYHEAVDFVLENSLMDGFTDGTFRPNGTLTRAMLAQILYNKEGRPAVSGGSGFRDVAETDWYADAVNWAAKNGLVTGYPDGTFAPNDPITREQLAVILWRCAGKPSASGTLNFPDADQVSSYALEAMLWATQNGVLNGNTRGLLNPQGHATRAEVAQMLMNYMQKIER